MMKVNELNELKKDCIVKQKKGLHFILASVIIWALIVGVELTNWPILIKNLFIFCCSAPLMPIAFLLSKLLGIDFQNKENPLTKLGILFAANQVIYLLIPMWLFQASPENMLMVFAIIFGAHLMPFSWLYESRSYLFASIIIPIVSLFVGLKFGGLTLAIVMFVIESLFSLFLWIETGKQNLKAHIG
jgi:hypothetical protein